MYLKGDPFCVASYNDLFATGGEDDLMYLWSYNCENSQNGNQNNCKLIMQSEKFNDSVTNLCFSCDGKYLAVADMVTNLTIFLKINFYLIFF